MTTESQNKWVLKYMQSGFPITSMEAIDKKKITRLAARISDLKKMGHIVKTEMVIVGNNKKKVARYSLNQ